MSAPIIERLFARTDIESIFGCWLWTGATDRCGYGQIAVDRRTTTVHRAAFIAIHGMAPPEIDHSCGSRACWNPMHLRVATRAQNEAWKLLVGPLARGVRRQRSGRWQAQIGKERRYLGTFDTEAEAAAAYAVAARVRYGQFARTN